MSSIGSLLLMLDFFPQKLRGMEGRLPEKEATGCRLQYAVLYHVTRNFSKSSPDRSPARIIRARS